MTDDDWVRAVANAIRTYRAGRYYGRIVVEIMHGEILRLETLRSIKDPREVGAELDALHGLPDRE